MPVSRSSCFYGSGVERVDGPIDLAIANPPFILDGANRAYRDGGGTHGAQLCRSIGPGCRGPPARPGRPHASLHRQRHRRTARTAWNRRSRPRSTLSAARLHYAELDPDIFGEQLDEPGYEEVERIAAVGAVISR